MFKSLKYWYIKSFPLNIRKKSTFCSYEKDITKIFLRHMIVVSTDMFSYILAFKSCLPQARDISFFTFKYAHKSSG